ncbi:hypothetical protein BJF92_06905 [Rhizobium rhizosphaerae]|uniref:FAD dependent oxidoreductase n=1 Tax=Xaviernesmea rhizosphaerae TaxID=1672749 RepID=A0A1Q9APG0_9HYPH|nr:FAD-dependent oxidoreductase [Xaviernesmea rhizosphaerae]OLP57248.1 hypothetical protein BJF92_06905 [Xaviernesmea rhizosphaerae]
MRIEDWLRGCAALACGMALALAPLAAQTATAQQLITPVDGPAPQAEDAAGACTRADIVVYGGTPGGIAAALQAARMKKKVLLLEPTQHIGGMMTSGLNKTDASPRRGVYGGIVKEFFNRASAAYGLGDTVRVYFESKWAERTFAAMLREDGVKLVRGQLITSVKRSGKTIASLTTVAGRSFCGSTYIDASYEGDLMKLSGASTVVGRESRAKYREDAAGVQKLNFPNVGDKNNPDYVKIDPYIVPGNPKSGLLPGISPIGQQPIGAADKSLMAFNYRLCVTQSPGNITPFTQPADYDPMRYEALARFIAALKAKGTPIGPGYFVGDGDTVKGKLDVNSNPYFSTNVWNISYGYAVGTEVQRVQIRQSVRSYIQGLLWFAVSDPRVPAKVRAFTAKYGYCADEFVDNGNFPYQMYVRQARRLLGQYVLTENDLEKKTVFNDAIGLGYYPMDQHGMIRTVLNGFIGEDIRQSISVGPYQIPYRSMLPKRNEVTNLLVPVALSTSHVAYTSVRVEPTYMVLGQAAGAAAALAPGGNVSNVNIVQLKSQLAKAGQVMNWN